MEYAGCEVLAGGPRRSAANASGSRDRSFGKIDALRIGEHYQTSYGTLWKDGTYFARGTRVLITGLHLEQGFCVRFPLDVDGEPLETWEEWAESEFLVAEGTIDDVDELPPAILAEAREVLDDAEDGTHLHLHESGD